MICATGWFAGANQTGVNFKRGVLELELVFTRIEGHPQKKKKKPEEMKKLCQESKPPVHAVVKQYCSYLNPETQIMMKY
ncbi:hypothetical protein ES703_23247 [subsurface metagenome]